MTSDANPAEEPTSGRRRIEQALVNLGRELREVAARLEDAKRESVGYSANREAVDSGEIMLELKRIGNEARGCALKHGALSRIENQKPNP